MKHTNAFLRDRSRPKSMQQTQQLESLSPCSSQDHTQGRTLKHTCKNTSTCFISWMCSGLRHSRDGMSHNPGTTHTPQDSCTVSWGTACPLLHSPGQTGAISWLWPQQLPHPGSTSNSTAWQDTGFCYRPLWEIITVQFVPSNAAKSTQLKNAPHSELQREDLAQAAASLPCSYTLQFLHLFLFCVGWQTSALSINLPFTSWCWSYSFGHDCNYNPVVFFPFFLFILLYFCYHHSVPDLPLLVCSFLL